MQSRVNLPGASRCIKLVAALQVRKMRGVPGFVVAAMANEFGHGERIQRKIGEEKQT